MCYFSNYSNTLGIFANKHRCRPRTIQKSQHQMEQRVGLAGIAAGKPIDKIELRTLGNKMVERLYLRTKW